MESSGTRPITKREVVQRTVVGALVFGAVCTLVYLTVYVFSNFGQVLIRMLLAILALLMFYVLGSIIFELRDEKRERARRG